MELGLCLALKTLNLLGNPLADRLPPAPQSDDQGQGEGEDEYEQDFDQDQGADQQVSTRRKGQDQQDSPPPTFLEVYSLGQPHTLEDLTQRDALVRRGTKALLAAVRDRLDEGQCGEVRHMARLRMRLNGARAGGVGEREAGRTR